MSNREALLPKSAHGCAELVSSSSGYVVSVSLVLALSVAAKLRLMARYAALAVLGEVRNSYAISSRLLRFGGAYRDRTDDLMLAKQPLSQLS